MDKISLMDLNNNDTEIPEDQLEVYALQLDAKGFVGRTKAKAKPQRRELAGSSSRIVPMNQRNWFELNQRYILSLRTRFRRK